MFNAARLVRPLSPDGRAVTPRLREKLVRAVMAQGFRRELHRAGERNVGRSGDPALKGPIDVLLAGPGEPRLPDEVFGKLRWGGLFICVGAHQNAIARIAAEFDGKRGFHLERPLNRFDLAPLGLRLPGITPRGYYFAARKTQLIQPGDFTERFTYHVELKPDPDAEHGYVVSKRVPTHPELMAKLKHKDPAAEPADLDQRARKLIDHIFPTFLTREAAILKILQRDLPPPFRGRVPRPLAISQNERGLVDHLTMTWLRVGGEPISQLRFAREAAELLYILHEKARIMHLDLRIDNMVVTEQGVGFVDFGSAVRIGEKFDHSPMLTTLFTEMMRTSHIQRMLGKMLDTGQVTSKVMKEVHGKVDRTVDAFYLSVQIARPTAHPELRRMIGYDPTSREAKMLGALTAAILRPKNVGVEHYKTAADILRGLRRIEQRLSNDRALARAA